MRILWATSLLVSLAACTSGPPAPDSGVGFGDYDEYLAQQAREAENRRRGIQPGMAVSSESSAPVAVLPVEPATPTTAPVVDTLADEAEARTETAMAQTPVDDPNNPNISDEQNFDAVSSRETIESDRERLEQQRQKFVIIEPTNLPRRKGTDFPNIVAYALATNNPVGTKLYDRFPLANAKTHQKNCARYLNSDQAQEAFLTIGGPKRDPKRLDPDGDGFACAWDPSLFRIIQQ